MFDLKLALRKWNGKVLTLAELRQLLSELRLQNLGEFPPEINVREMIVIALDMGCIVEDDAGKLHIQVK